MSEPTPRVSGVKRYDFIGDTLCIQREGEFVKYEDHEAEIAQLKARNAVYERIMGNDVQAFADEFELTANKLAAAEAKIARVRAIKSAPDAESFGDDGTSYDCARRVDIDKALADTEEPKA
jgi:hypothetical protein